MNILQELFLPVSLVKPMACISVEMGSAYCNHGYAMVCQSVKIQVMNLHVKQVSKAELLAVHIYIHCLINLFKSQIFSLIDCWFLSTCDILLFKLQVVCSRLYIFSKIKSLSCF